MNVLNLLLGHQVDDELDAAVWIDDQSLLRPIATFLAHHRRAHAIATTAIGVALAPIVAVANVAATAGNVIDRAHEVAGEGTAPCQPCVNAEANEFAASGTLTYEDACHAWDMKDGGLL